MTKPIRVQLKRVKGWKLPPNTVSVTRPGYYGNPYKIDGDPATLPFVVVSNIKSELNGPLTREQVVEAFEIYLDKHADGKRKLETARREIVGKNLACFCKLDKVCHADIWLKKLNE